MLHIKESLNSYFILVSGNIVKSVATLFNILLAYLAILI